MQFGIDKVQHLLAVRIFKQDKLSSVFKDFSTKIKFNDDKMQEFKRNKYKPKCEVIFADDASSMKILDENLG